MVLTFSKTRRRDRPVCTPVPSKYVLPPPSPNPHCLTLSLIDLCSLCDFVRCVSQSILFANSKCTGPRRYTHTSQFASFVSHPAVAASQAELENTSEYKALAASEAGAGLNVARGIICAFNPFAKLDTDPTYFDHLLNLSMVWHCLQHISDLPNCVR